MVRLCGAAQVMLVVCSSSSEAYLEGNIHSLNGKRDGSSVLTDD